MALSEPTINNVKGEGGIMANIGNHHGNDHHGDDHLGNDHHDGHGGDIHSGNGGDHAGGEHMLLEGIQAISANAHCGNRHGGDHHGGDHHGADHHGADNHVDIIVLEDRTSEQVWDDIMWILDGMSNKNRAWVLYHYMCRYHSALMQERHEVRLMGGR